jgi:uncharacterized protein (DUF362 family)
VVRDVKLGRSIMAALDDLAERVGSQDLSLIVLAIRIHHETGGNLADVKLAKTVVASHDIVAADAYATTLFGMPADAISYVKAGAARGLGTMDLKSIKIEEITA